tara:strand:- start:218 stop:511 length:294 start_codon:yes stop_codon:yes gene_type:complete
MFAKITKVVLIEYLIKEIDCLMPVEEIYETYCNKLYEISDLNFNLTYTSFRQKFIMKITSMKKNDILTFCKEEVFMGSIDLVQRVLKRTLTVEEFDL